MNDKIKITNVIFDLCKDKLDPKVDIEKLYFSWWATGRTGNGLRLTEDGKHIFDILDIEYYDFPLHVTSSNYSNKIIELGKKINCPFYVGFHNQRYKSAYIRLYDSKVAMMVTLYGSVEDFLQATK